MLYGVQLALCLYRKIQTASENYQCGSNFFTFHSSFFTNHCHLTPEANNDQDISAGLLTYCLASNVFPKISVTVCLCHKGQLTAAGLYEIHTRFPINHLVVNR